MKIKNIFFICFLLFSSNFLFSQIQLKYIFKIEKNKIDSVVEIIKENIGDVNFKKNGKFIWVERKNEYEYKISLKKKKVQIFYKGNNLAIEKKIRFLHEKIKD